METPLISVIVPVYNSGDYLIPCLDSLLAQTCTDFEAICVDDGSSDGSGKTLDAYAQKDGRFRVIHQTNAGQGAARNRALELARGKYVYCLDSDDLIKPETLKTLAEAAERDALDIVVFGGDKIYEGAVAGSPGHPDRYILPHGFFNEILSGPESIVRWHAERAFYIAPPLRLFRRSLLLDNQVRFLEGTTYEDSYFTPLATLVAARTKMIPDRLYVRRCHETSTTGLADPDANARRVTALVYVYSQIADTLSSGRHPSFASPAARLVLLERLAAVRKFYLALSAAERLQLGELLAARVSPQTLRSIANFLLPALELLTPERGKVKTKTKAQETGFTRILRRLFGG